MRLLCVCLLVSLVAACDFPERGEPGYFVVNTNQDLADVSPGDTVCAARGGLCSLRAAIQESNAMSGANTVELPAGLYLLTLPGSGGVDQGDLNVTGPTRVLGAGSANTIIDGNGEALNTRIFTLTSGSLELRDVTLQNGGSFSVSSGGAIRQEAGALTLTRAVLTGNEAFSNGGAIVMVAGILQITDSTIADNEVTSRGGGLYASTGTTIGIDRSTFSGNLSTLGGAIQSFGTVTAYNSTFSGNEGSAGTGGIINGGDMTLNNVTITQNISDEETAGRAGGISNNDGATLRLANTIIAGNQNTAGGSPDCAGTLTSQGYNLVQSTSGCVISGVTTGNVVGVAPGLGALSNNGGFTRTHAVLSTSPARNAGNPAPPAASGGSACRPEDQRNVARPQGPRCDIGAYERD